MTVTRACYCTREDVQLALDVKSTSRTSGQIDRAIADVSEDIDGSMHRMFYPLQAVRKFDWPDYPTVGAFPWRMWLEDKEVAIVDSVVSGGVAIPPSGYLLEPVNDGPPYDRLDINLGSNSAFSSGVTWQQSLLVTGTFIGCPIVYAPAGALANAMADTTGTVLDATDSSALGVGSTLLVGSERVLVTGRRVLTTGQVLQAPGMAKDTAAVTMVVPDGTAYQPNEVLLVDSERMWVDDVAGNNVTVKRGWDGSVLALHTAGTTIYTYRRLTVVRGFTGTTAATHLAGAATTVFQAPALIQSLAVGESMNRLLTEQSGYARTVGSGDNERNASGAGLADLRKRAAIRWARKSRQRTV